MIPSRWPAESSPFKQKSFPGVFELLKSSTSKDVELVTHTLATDKDQTALLRHSIARANSPVALALLTEAQNPGVELNTTEEAVLHGMRVAFALLDRASLKADVASLDIAS